MNKSEFEQAVRTELMRVPIAERRTWDNNKLFFWFMKAKTDNPRLTWDRCPGDPWQWVPGICKHLIGPNAF
ncbi:hypothetical protein [Geothrix paludis]|uniref:hypothetical protein n=1 Tax=Geothrix paludis TaxID=2922722 RepID=UPI001FADD052|nr:hypothetical protein [Geothrix paludis]